MEFIVTLLILFPWSLLVVLCIKLAKYRFRWLKDIREYEKDVLQYGPDCLEAIKMRNKYRGDKRFGKCADYIHKMYRIKSAILNNIGER